ncbi:primosomal protein DnaI [Spiroplasma sp. NBRC 100390]|uniref:ATP-binding protein n=1 Tax=unclassified Spiroplasma TaxID=2637901 RepID=UPI0008929526|nr:MULTISPECIES: ATP-binding protein [unclassified Spiroplasma]AOX43489.1 primosomal protein DnaI [Spiroplasma sp. TU-14]APE12959.1 primosomal protein DnaI [Spiroplasma sp. NBRC 100390]
MAKLNLLEQIKSNKELMLNLQAISFDINDYEKFSLLFEEYLNNYHYCESMPNLSLCQQQFKGYKYYFRKEVDKLFLTRVECNHMITLNEVNKVKNNYLYYDFSDELLKLRLNDIKKDENFNNMHQIIGEMVKFVKGQRQKGLYIYGEPGVGKTYLLIRLANVLANNNRKVAFISVINLINRVKESFNLFNNESSLIDDLLRADILFLDDIGGETVSPWVRDDLLFRILNDRISRQLPTFFSSNFTTTALTTIYANVKNEIGNKEINNIKALRIVDRIRGLATELELIGNSRRSDNDYAKVWTT